MNSNNTAHAAIPLVALGLATLVACSPWMGPCQDLDQDGYYVGECDATAGVEPLDADEDPTIYPGAPEFCDGIDNDLDSLVDEERANVMVYPDADGDGYGVEAGGFSTCLPPANSTTLSGDCDDSDAEIRPGSVERCGGADEDCDGVVDEGFDGDGDGYGDCVDCNDADPAVNPGASEVDYGHDGIDQDCDDVADDGLAPEVEFIAVEVLERANVETLVVLSCAGCSDDFTVVLTHVGQSTFTVFGGTTRWEPRLQRIDVSLHIPSDAPLGFYDLEWTDRGWGSPEPLLDAVLLERGPSTVTHVDDDSLAVNDVRSQVLRIYGENFDDLLSYGAPVVTIWDEIGNSVDCEVEFATLEPDYILCDVAPTVSASVQLQPGRLTIEVHDAQATILDCDAKYQACSNDLLSGELL